MKTIAIACAALATVLASMAVSATDRAAADLLDVEGSVIGKATFEQTPHGVLMYIEAAGLPPGGHGIHLHTVGTCTPDFSAAKGHINPEGVKHGLRNPEGPDNGNLPNLYVAADGSVTAEFFTTLVSVAAGEMPALLDEDGSTVIIHERLDDHMTQPIGGAGGRISCGVIRRM
ncbi:MAG: superoxide dismutase family protein [Gammaproteobacteria bacterium]|nr:superoxide dismutase family protein [Gammaproteobacteria bacterium]